MIRKLRIKFIAISMTSTIIVLFLILGSINLLNYREMSHNADTILDFLKENDVELPENLYKSQHKKTNGISPETSFESRYFSVFLSNNRQRCEADTDNISAIDEETAIKYAQKINRSNKNCGFISKYRYMKENTSNEVKIYFLDCTKSMMSFQTFLVTSFFVSIFGVSTVFILVVLLSKRAIEPVTESYEKQKRFITDAGHEIKTPLTIIDADTSILEMEYGENEWLDDIQVQTKRLAGLTNDLIYLSRMEEKQTKTTMIEFPFSEVISEEAQSFQGLAKVKGKNFMVDIEPMLSLKGDEKTIRQLISILLDNAIKFTPAGGTIRFSVEKLGPEVEISIWNSGQGISPEALPYVFQRFYKEDRSRGLHARGAGLGLNICKVLVNLSGGQIRVESQQGEWCKFVFTLPTQPPNPGEMKRLPDESGRPGAVEDPASMKPVN